MAQNGPHVHQVGGAASDDGHNAPPATVAFNLMASAAGPYGNAGSGSSAGNKGKNLIPDLNIEELDDSADDNKDKPLSEEEVVEVDVAYADAGDAGADKGKSVVVDVADDDDEVNVNIVLEPERRNRMKDLFGALQDLMPHVPRKTDRVTLVGEAINYIKFLEEKAAIMGKRKLQEALARQAAGRGEASSSSSSLTATPQTAQGMAALSSSDVPAVPAPAAPAAPAPPVRFKTWTGRNVVLTVANDNAYISACAPRRANTLTMLMYVLDRHGIDVITAQVSSDSVRALYLIFAQVTGTDGMNRLSEQVFQRAMWEIMLRLNISN